MPRIGLMVECASEAEAHRAIDSLRFRDLESAEIRRELRTYLREELEKAKLKVRSPVMMPSKESVVLLADLNEVIDAAAKNAARRLAARLGADPEGEVG